MQQFLCGDVLLDNICIKVIENDHILYNTHEFVLVFHCNDGHIVSETM